jgi:hypothetical protein
MAAAVDQLLSPDELRALWFELLVPRAAVHRRHQVRTCDTELSMGGLSLGARTVGAPPSRYRLAGGCPCRDLVADAIEIVLTFLTDHGGKLRNPPGAVRRHLRFRLVDLHRRARSEVGAPARPETVAGNRYGRALPDDFHRALFVVIADEAGIHGPLLGREGFLRRLADRCAAEFGAEAKRRLPAALRLIEKTCRKGPRVNVGTRAEPELVTWWEAYIERPLGRRYNPADHPIGPPAGPGRAVDVTDPAASRAFDQVVSVESNEDIVLRTLLSTIGSAHDADAELRRVIELLGARDLLPQSRVRSLLTDTSQRRRVITYVHELKPRAT